MPVERTLKRNDNREWRRWRPERSLAWAFAAILVMHTMDI
jgi:hypothetical protein